MNKKKYKRLDPVAKKCIDNNSGHAFGDWAATKIDNQNWHIKMGQL